MPRDRTSSCKIIKENNQIFTYFTAPDGQTWRAKTGDIINGRLVENKKALLGAGAYGKVFTATNSNGEEEPSSSCEKSDHRDIASIKKEAQEELNVLSVLYNQADRNAVSVYENVYGDEQIAVLMPKIHGHEASNIAQSVNLFSNHTENNIPISHRFNCLNSYFTQLNDLHNKGYIHSDIKLQNTLVTNPSSLHYDQDGSGYDGNYYLPFMSLIDLGLATKVNDFGERLFYNAGTPVYMSKEAMQGHASVASDIYSSSEIALSVLGCDTVTSFFENRDLKNNIFDKLQMKNLTPEQEDKLNTQMHMTEEIIHSIHPVLRSTLKKTYSQVGRNMPTQFGFRGLDLVKNSVNMQIQNLFNIANSNFENKPHNIHFNRDNLRNVIQMMLDDNPLARPSAAELSEFFSNYESMIIQLETLKRLSNCQDIDPISRVLSSQSMTPEIFKQRFDSMPMSSKINQARRYYLDKGIKEAHESTRKTLSQDKETLSQDKETLSQDKETLSQDKETLSQDKETLSQDKETLSQDKETLSQDKETLSQDKETLSQDKETLSNQELAKYFYEKQRVDVISQFLSNWLESESSADVNEDSKKELSKIISEFSRDGNLKKEKELRKNFNVFSTPTQDYDSILSSYLDKFISTTFDEIQSRSNLLDKLSRNIRKGLCRKNFHAINPKIEQLRSEISEINHQIDSLDNNNLQRRPDLQSRKNRLQQSLAQLKGKPFPEQYTNWRFLKEKKEKMLKVKQFWDNGDFKKAYIHLTGNDYYKKQDFAYELREKLDKLTKLRRSISPKKLKFLNNPETKDVSELSEILENLTTEVQDLSSQINQSKNKKLYSKVKNAYKHIRVRKKIKEKREQIKVVSLKYDILVAGNQLNRVYKELDKMDEEYSWLNSHSRAFKRVISHEAHNADDNLFELKKTMELEKVNIDIGPVKPHQRGHGG